jgi:S-formylglutathione hydrolase
LSLPYGEDPFIGYIPEMDSSQTELHDLASAHLPNPVPYAILTPPGYQKSMPLPLCLLLMGGGGSRQNLVDCQPLFDAWWSAGSVPPMVVATPSPGMSYYIEDPAGERWESFLAGDFVPHLRRTCNVDPDRRSSAITGISMGGYGALKTAFRRPEIFGIVAAMQPMMEPGFHDSQVTARNRLHHVVGGPARLIGPTRDPEFLEANQPANLARANAASIRDSALAIYLDAGDEDFLNAHDGAEFLHRVLWDLDISHEYHLVRGGDHGGPTMRPRMHAMFKWTGAVITALRSVTEEPTPADHAVTAWIESGLTGPPPPLHPSSREFLRMVRAHLASSRALAATTDPTTTRRFGVVPNPSAGRFSTR